MVGAKTSLLMVFMGFFALMLFCGSQKANSRGNIAKETNVAREANVVTNENNMAAKKGALINIELGLGYLSQGNMAKAKGKLLHALQLAPKMSETHLAMAYYLEKVGNNREAEKYYQQAIRYGVLQSNKGAVYNNYGTFLCRQGQYEAADKAFHQALTDKKYLKVAEVYENAGVCAFQSHAPAQGKEYFLKAIQHDPQKKLTLQSYLEQ